MSARLDAELLIAMRTHWSRAEIRAFSVHEFNHYLKRVSQKNDD